MMDTLLVDNSFRMILNAAPRSKLVSLDISRNENLTVASYELVARLLPQLRYLNCEANYMGDLGIKALLGPATSGQELAQSVRLDPSNSTRLPVDLLHSLKVLNISKNKLTDVGGAVVAKFLERSTKLETL